METAEITYLPDQQKKELCLELLREFGATRVRERGAELQHNCTLPMGGHTDNNSYAASINYKELAFNCLTGDTLVKVRHRGDVPIRDLAGQTVELLDGNGQWVMAPVRHYGQDRIYRVTMTRNKIRKVIECTADHRWYIKTPGVYGKLGKTSGLTVVQTTDLRPKNRIPSIWPSKRTGRTFLSPLGVMSGFVYGDGSSTEWGGVANFFGEKDAALEPYFRDFKMLEYPEWDLRKVVAGLPRSWKQLPPLDDGPSYLYGWLAGYFAADGCVDDRGQAILSSADKAALEHVMAVCDVLGIGYFPIRTQSRVGKGTVATDLHHIALRTTTLGPEFLLLPSHRERFKQGVKDRKHERTNWWVTSVEETDRMEDVYCAEVSTTHSFVLADNVLTGNCFVCGYGGSLAWWVAVHRGEDSGTVEPWLRKKLGIGSSLPIGTMLQVLDDIFHPPAAKKILPKYPERILDRWNVRPFHPYLTETRKIPEATLERFKIGYAEDDADFKYHRRIVVPVFWRDNLVGWQARALATTRADDPDFEIKYKNSLDFPRDLVLYGDLHARRAVLVESPMSVLRHIHQVPVVATLGSNLTDWQLRALERYDELILFNENDKAGWKMIRQVSRALERKVRVNVVDNPYHGDVDPADLDDDTFMNLVEDAVPSSIWTPRRYAEQISYIAP